jgi:hypothetical protein
MASETFTLVHRAILDRQQLVFRYGGFMREVCPHILGYKDSAAGAREKMLAFQFAGGSRRGLPPGGEWRCFALADMQAVTAREGRWHSGASHQKPQACVDRVYVDVNTDVPDQPGRR